MSSNGSLDIYQVTTANTAQVGNMITAGKEMGCGGCGSSTFRIFMLFNGDLVTECTGCNSTSIISVSKPQIEIRWGDGEGCLSVTPKP